MQQQLFFVARQQVKGATEWIPLSPEDVLHTGDRYQFEVQTVRPAYVYVARTSAEGVPDLLTPRPGTSPVRTAAPAPLRLPASKEVFLLDGRVGDESIVCIAADQELPEVTLSQYLGSTPPAEQGNGREIPPALTDKNRGKTVYYLGKVLASGVLGLRFSFQRQK